MEDPEDGATLEPACLSFRPRVQRRPPCFTGAVCPPVHLSTELRLHPAQLYGEERVGTCSRTFQ